LTRDRPGKDLSGLPAAREKGGPSAVRDGTRCAYKVFVCIDGDFVATDAVKDV
jgi:hypothetical protein